MIAPVAQYSSARNTKTGFNFPKIHLRKPFLKILSKIGDSASVINA